uniref:Uncharacterized protein n=1 Tax=Lepeophtheirus salmonis TaxID=72036 RepID=A0A0K2UTS0_LEPSM
MYKLEFNFVAYKHLNRLSDTNHPLHENPKFLSTTFFIYLSFSLS